jgi:hypothetical protein
MVLTCPSLGDGMPLWTGAIGPRTTGGGKRKAGPLWEGEIQRAPGLTIR